MTGVEDYIAALEARVNQLQDIVDMLRRENEELRRAMCQAIDQLHADNMEVKKYLQHLDGLTRTEE